MNVLVTGASGFIGRNLCTHLSLDETIKTVTFTRDDSIDTLVQDVKEADFIYHIAGVNRPENETDFKKYNTDLTKQIISILRDSGKRTPLLITSSTQAELDNPYGHSKLDAETSVFEWHRESNAPVHVYRLPGVFGKWARPNYNSVVATFCHNIAHGLPITISDENHSVDLVYIDDVIRTFVSLLHEMKERNYATIQSVSPVFSVTLGELSQRLKAIHDIRISLMIPDLSDPLNKYLYATYISYLPTDAFSYSLTKNSDDRGWLAEFIKSEYAGQIFVSKTKPGISRGNHWHHTKIEKFFVVSGKGSILFRDKRDSSEEIIEYIVDGDDAKVVDIPVGYVHSIKNVGDTDLVTIFWANELLDKDRPDTFYEKVT